jgi:hypothetical protein
MRGNCPPEDLFQALLAKSTKSKRVKNLKIIHAICEAQYASSRDFSRGTIGRLSQASGGVCYRAIYNAASADYCLLIAAWAKWAGPSRPNVASQGMSGVDLIRLVDDPVARALIHARIVDRDRLFAEVKLLKASSQLTVDMRPASIRQDRQQDAHDKLVLTTSEREALQKAVSAAFLANQGWTEGRHGEINAASGRRIFEVGFLRALRKILNDKPEPYAQM